MYLMIEIYILQHLINNVTEAVDAPLFKLDKLVVIGKK